MSSAGFSNWLFKAASLLCAVVLLAHELVGAPMVLKPLSVAGIDEEVALLHQFSWHVGTISVVAMASMYFYASTRPRHLALAIIATAMSVGYWLLAISMAVFKSSAMWSTPAPYFWFGIALLGGLGIWAAMSVKEHQ